MGEVFLQSLVEGRHDVASAGLRPDEPYVDAQSVDAARRLGYAIEPSRRPRRVTQEMLRAADLVLTMERRQTERVVSLLPAAASRAFTMKELAYFVERDSPGDLASALPGWHAERSSIPAGVSLDIDDPWAQSDKVFDACAREILDASERIASSL